MLQQMTVDVWLTVVKIEGIADTGFQHLMESVTVVIIQGFQCERRVAQVTILHNTRLSVNSERLPLH